MSGQGSPISNRLTIASVRQSSRIAVFAFAWLVGLATQCLAQSPPAQSPPEDRRKSDTSTVDDLREQYRRLQDDATKPFQLRFPSETFPVDPAAHPGKLTVQVVGLRKHAGQTLTLQYRLYRVEDGEQIEREQTDIKLSDSGVSEVIELDDAAPLATGVYEIRCKLLESTEKIWSKIRGDKPEIASIQIPWMIHADSEKARETPASPLAWQRLGEASVFDHRSWDSPWSFSPWPGNSKDQKPDGTNSQSVVWQLPKHAPHRLCRVRIDIRRSGRPESKSTGDSAPQGKHTAGPDAKLEFSSTPEFKHVSRAESLSAVAELDLSSGENGETYQFQTLHYPAVEREFVRVTGLSRDQRFEIRSIEVDRLREPSQQGPSEPTDVPPLETEIPAMRISLEVGSMDWADEVTTDFAGIFPDRNFSANTQRIYRVWKASQRMTDYSRWLGFDELTVPFDSGGRVLASHPAMVPEGLKTGQLDSAEKFTNANTLLAMYRWLDKTDLRLVARIDGHFTLMQDSKHPSTTDAYPAFDPLVEPQLRRCLADWSELFRHGDKTSRFAVGVNRALVEAGGNAETQPGVQTRVALSFLPESRYDFLNSISKNALGELVIELNSPAQLVLQRCVGILGECRRIPGTRRPFVVNRLKSEKPTESSVDYVSVFTDAAGVTLANSAPWTTEVTLKFNRPVSSVKPDVQWKRRRSEGDPSAIRLGARTNECLVELKPLEVIGLDVFYQRGVPMPAALMSYQATVVGGQVAIQAIKSHVGEVVRKIGNLAQPDDYTTLLNGGFESQGQVGIVGWMHTQFPSDAVALDPTEAIEGNQSICMTTGEKSMGRTWLVSAPFSVPLSGRLAVSLATRSSIPVASALDPGSTGSTSSSLSSTRRNPFAQVSRIEASDGKTKKPMMQRVRVSLEGSRLGEPVRYVSEFEVPRDGQWTERRIVLETDRLDASSIKELRLTIDSLSPGKLWIDDVHLHDQFATQAERAGMQGQAFLAIQGLQRNQLHPAARLLQNRWSRHLMNANTKPWASSYRALHHDVTADSVAVAPSSTRSTIGVNSNAATIPNGRSSAPRGASKAFPTSKRTSSNQNGVKTVTPAMDASSERQSEGANKSADRAENAMESNSTSIDRSRDLTSPRRSETGKTTEQSRIRDKLSKPRPGIAERLKGWLPRPLRF